MADIAWRFPPRPPLSSELAVDLRTAPRPAAYVFASRRLFAAREWRPEGPLPEGSGSGTAAARFTSMVAQETWRTVEIKKEELTILVLVGKGRHG